MGAIMVGRWMVLAALVMTAFPVAHAQQKSQAPQQQSPKAGESADDPSGMYSFLKDGEFVQLNIEDGKLSGYISRFGDADSDKGEFIDQFFDKASLEGNRLAFTTKVVHGVSYEFNGTVTVIPGKQHGQEGYRVLKGTLIQHAADAAGNDKASQREVEFKSFPEDMGRS
jgi:hypothetical protein